MVYSVGVFNCELDTQIVTNRVVQITGNGEDRKCNLSLTRDKWAPVTTALYVLRLRTEERHPIRRAAANILNKQSRKADKELFSRLGVGGCANNSSL